MRFAADWLGRYKDSVRVHVMAVSSWPKVAFPERTS
jgi:hypothetical protein